MVNEAVIQKWNSLLQNAKGLVPANHLLLYDCLAVPDEDIVAFIQSFILVGPEQNGKRMIVKRLELSFSDFTYPGDSSVAASVTSWLSGSTPEFPEQNQFVTFQHNSWKPSQHTKNPYRPEGAFYTPLFN